MKLHAVAEVITISFTIVFQSCPQVYSSDGSRAFGLRLFHDFLVTLFRAMYCEVVAVNLG